MDEYVYVEFLFDQDNCMTGADEIVALGNDFILLNSELEYTDTKQTAYHRTKGKIRSATATAIKLRNSVLSASMHISYISDELKNKYRNR